MEETVTWFTDCARDTGTRAPITTIEEKINLARIDHRRVRTASLLSQEGARLLTESGPGTAKGCMSLTRVDEWVSCFARNTSLPAASACGGESVAAEIPPLPVGMA